MKRYSFFLILISLSFLDSSCLFQRQEEKEVKDELKAHPDFRDIEIDLADSFSLNTENFIDSVHYIALETTNDSELSEVSQIEVFENLYVILDRISNSIFFFDKKGGFLHKISAKNKDIPIPFKNIKNFTINEDKKKIIFQDFLSEFIYEFDLEGNFIKTKEKTPIEINVRESYIQKTHEIQYFSYDNPTSDATSVSNIRVLDPDLKESNYLFYEPDIISYKDIYGAQKYFFKSHNQVFFSRPYDYTIYSFDNSGEMFKAFKLSMPSKSKVPEDFLKSLTYKNKRRAYTDKTKGLIYLVTNVYKVGEKLTFKLRGNKYSNTFLYDLSEGALVDLGHYLSDVSTFFLPIMGYNIIGADGNSLISSIPSSHLINAMTSNIGYPNYLNRLPDNLKEIFQRGNNQNPTLILINLKDQIRYEKKK